MSIYIIDIRNSEPDYKGRNNQGNIKEDGKMKKTGKMSTSLTAIIGLVVLVSMVVLYFASSNGTKGVLQEAAINEIKTSLNDKKLTIDEYMGGLERTLKNFSVGSEVIAMLKNPSDAAAKAAAQAYTEKYFNSMEGWQGYVDDNTCLVLTHNNPKTVGLQMRKGDAAKQLTDSISGSSTGVYNLGIIVSPADGSLVNSLYAAVYDENKQMIGFAGAGVAGSILKEKMDENVAIGFSNAKTALINMNSGIYIFDSDDANMAQEVTDPNVLAIMEKAKNGSDEGMLTFKDAKGVDQIAVYQSLPERGWLIITTDTTEEIFALAKNVQTTLLIICLVAFILISVFAWLVIRFKTISLTKVAGSIEKLQQLNLTEDTTMIEYSQRKDEIGLIADATVSLTETFRNLIDTLVSCSASLNGSSDNMTATSRELQDSIEDGAATTEELSASIINTNESIDVMNDEISKMVDMVREINKTVEKSKEQSAKLIDAAGDMSNICLLYTSPSPRDRG